MARRHGRGEPGQIPFADLAMATLGPMVFLMIIFLLFAAIPCPDCPFCRQLSDWETERWAHKLQKWAEKMENIRGNKIVPTIACEEFSRLKISDRKKIYEIDTDPIIPPSLYDLCPEDAIEVLERAGLSKEKLNILMENYQNAMKDKYHSLLGNMAKCVKPPPEKFTVTTKEVEFKTCSTTFIDPKTGKPMTENEKKHLFAQITKNNIVSKLNDHPEYNRIDIFGHSDKRKINEGGCRENGAKTNRQLASFRVHAFLEEVEASLEANHEISGFQQVFNRWKIGDLKIYAIGVGEKEPIDEGTSDEAYRKNRRIEIRFGVDRR